MSSSLAVALEVTALPVDEIRRIPVPYADPPFDDEQPGRVIALNDHPAEQATLDLVFSLPTGVPAVPEPPVLRLVPPVDPDEAGPIDPNVCPMPWRKTAAVELPEPGAWAPKLVQALVEVLNGVRPTAQLVRWTTEAVYSAVQRQVARTVPAARTTGRGPGLSVRSVRTSEPLHGVAEVTAVIQIGPRVRALALRIEALADRWQCTTLDLV